MSAISKGQTVAAFIAPAVVKDHVWPPIANARGLPDWAGIEGDHGFGPPAKSVLKCRFYDDAFAGMDAHQRPKWSYMNHSKLAPTARIVHPKRGVAVYWIALRDIDGGEEITFDYGPQSSPELDDVDEADQANVGVWPQAMMGQPHPGARRSTRVRRAPVHL